MSKLRNISGEKLIGLAAATAVALAQEFDVTDLNILSNFFSSLSGNLCILASQRRAAAFKEKKTEDPSGQRPG